MKVQRSVLVLLFFVVLFVLFLFTTHTLRSLSKRHPTPGGVRRPKRNTEFGPPPLRNVHYYEPSELVTRVPIAPSDSEIDLHVDSSHRQVEGKANPNTLSSSAITDRVTQNNAETKKILETTSMVPLPLVNLSTLQRINSLPQLKKMLKETEGDSTQSTSDVQSNESGKNNKKKKSKKGVFVILRSVETGQFLCRVLNTNQQRSSEIDRILQLRWHPRYHAWSVQGRTGQHLAWDQGGRITFDRPWARSYEQWRFHFVSPNRAGVENENDHPATTTKPSKVVVILQSQKSSAYVRHFSQIDADRIKENLIHHRHHRHGDNDDEDSSRTVVADARGAIRANIKASSPAEALTGGALQFEMFLAPCSSAQLCWPSTKEASSPSESKQHWAKKTRKALPHQIPIVGSPKPLPTDDMKDGAVAATIAKRTLQNWAALPLMLPLVLTTDSRTAELANEVEKHCQTSNGESSHLNQTTKKIRIDQTFENHKTYEQPTYRGLFLRAFELFPDAPAVMYSNGDILYPPTLAATINAAIQHMKEFDNSLKAMKAQQVGKEEKISSEFLKGWMIVGRRVNVDMPASLKSPGTAAAGVFTSNQQAITLFSSLEAASMGSYCITNVGNRSELLHQRWQHAHEDLASIGEVFQTNAEDYFIVSRHLFDWAKIPPFVVGGVAFDNWITAKAVRLAAKGQAIVIDATATISAIHHNHGEIKGSHKHPKSDYNRMLSSQNGGDAGGHCTDAPWSTMWLGSDRTTPVIFDKHKLLFG